MISTNDFRPGMTIELDGTVYSVIESQHVKPGKGPAFVRTKLRNIMGDYVIEKTFRAGEKVTKAHVVQSTKQYLYSSGDEFVFMDNDTYEQITLSREQLGDKINYLKENMNIEVSLYNGITIDINLPTFVELEITNTQPGIKGDTVSGGSKPAILETGASVQVPLFINSGDIIKVDTRTGEYIERVS